MDFWHGKLIRLRGVEPSDAEFFFEWNHDSDMARNLDQVWFPKSFEAVKQWAERTATQELKVEEFRAMESRDV